MLTITDLTCRIAGRPLLEGASMTLPAGHKAGLIGRNGTGKTTLLKLIAGDLHADTGEIRLPNNTRVGRIGTDGDRCGRDIQHAFRRRREGHIRRLIRCHCLDAHAVDVRDHRAGRIVARDRQPDVERRWKDERAPKA